jgi:RNA polymerase sigma factor (sigma-70 family)
MITLVASPSAGPDSSVAGPLESLATRAEPRALRSDFETALTRLYEKQFPALYRYLDRTLGDGQLATDIAQEAFIRLFDRGSMPDEPVAWLITVVNNLVRDDYRRTGRRLRLLESAGYNVGHSSSTPDASSRLDQQERREQVRDALTHLSPRDRQALLLRHSGYSYREVAVALGITETSVGTILLRAGALFREVYEELHGKPD